MTSVRRWLVVLAGIAVLCALPGAVAAWPVSAPASVPASLLARVQHSTGVAYSGYAESDGRLALPVTSQFTSVANLFGGHTQLRAWWRSATDWRVDSLGYTGETDVHQTPLGFWSWNYESDTATFTQQQSAPRIRLPGDADLLPPQLARRLLSEAQPSEAGSLPARRIAGIPAAGLRIRPDQPASTIDRVDVWVDPATALPLRVEVYGKGSSSAALSADFLDVEIRTPSPSSTAFTLPAGAALNPGGSPDLATVVDQFGGVTPPAELAGIARNRGLPQLGSVGVYGRGVTEFVAVPLPGRVGSALRDQLAPVAAAGNAAAGNSAAGKSAGDSESADRVAVSVGPLNLLLTALDDPGGGPWLLIGTVTADTLTAAAAELPSHPRFRR